MILQIPFITLLTTYGPIIIYLSFDIAILILAIFIYKKNSYKYGLYLMISSIISIISSILYMAINYPFLAYILIAVYGYSAYMVGFVLSIVGLIFLALGVSSAILLFLAIYQIYRTHKPIRNIHK